MLEIVRKYPWDLYIEQKEKLNTGEVTANTSADLTEILDLNNPPDPALHRLPREHDLDLGKGQLFAMFLS